MEKVGIFVIGAMIIVVLVVGGFFLFSGGFNSSSNEVGGIVVLDRVDSQGEEIIFDEKTNQDDNEVIEEETLEFESSETKEFDIIAKRWDFSPNMITVNEGDNVILNIESIDVTHGFTISGFGVSEQLVPGNTVKIEFVADKKGTFSFFCNIFCGSGHSGMKGTLVVE